MNPLPPRRSAAACTSAPKLVLAALLLALGIDSAHSAIVTLDAGNPGTGSALWLDSKSEISWNMGRSTSILFRVTNATVSSDDTPMELVYAAPPSRPGFVTERKLGPLDVDQVTFDSDTFAVKSIRFNVSLHIDVPAFKDGEENLTSTGGAISLHALQIDLLSGRVYADGWGANGAGSVTALHLFDVNQYAASALPRLAYLPPNLASPPSPNVRLSGSFATSEMDVTQPGFAWLSRALGLTPTGNMVLDYATFGTLSTPAVPEPSTWSLMAVGLFGVCAAAHRHAAPPARAKTRRALSA